MIIPEAWFLIGLREERVFRKLLWTYGGSRKELSEMTDVWLLLKGLEE